VSHTDRFTKPAPEFSRSTLELMADKADAIIDGIDEKEFNIKYIAQVVIDHFRDTLDEAMVFDERIGVAIAAMKKELQQSKHTHASWQRHCATNLASSALDAAGLIVNRQSSVMKAIEQFNREIQQRDKRHATRQSKRVDQRTLKAVPNDDRNPMQYSQPSRKQRPNRRNFATTRRRRAA
jgi:hypothetical protein